MKQFNFQTQTWIESAPQKKVNEFKKSHELAMDRVQRELKQFGRLVTPAIQILNNPESDLN